MPYCSGGYSGCCSGSSCSLGVSYSFSNNNSYGLDSMIEGPVVSAYASSSMPASGYRNGMNSAIAVGSAYGSGSRRSDSGVERIIMSGYEPGIRGYSSGFSGSSYSRGYHNVPRQTYQIVESFLAPVRPLTQFVDDASQIENYVRETFNIVTGKMLPDNISIKVCERDTLKKIHESNGAVWKEGILGFAVNRFPVCGEIFVMQSSLDRLMLVIGHELGHVMTENLGNSHDEEAKAFAFEFAWAKAIKDHDIAGLADCIEIDIMPANNGIHDIAFGFVKDALRNGMDAIDVFFSLVKRTISCRNSFLSDF